MERETRKGKRARLPTCCLDGRGQDAQRVPGEIQEDEPRGSTGQDEREELGIEACVAESGFKDGVFLGESPAEGCALANVGSDRYILFYL